MKRALVTGATGCIGRAVVSALLGAGWEVRGMARSPAPPDWPAAAEFFRGEIEDDAGVRAAADGRDAVIHLAGWVHRAPRTDADRHALRRSIVDGTRNVVTAAAGARVVYASTVAVYGSFPPGPVDDATPPAPDTPYGLAKLEAEELVRSGAPASTILRVSLVYGPGDRGNFAALAGALRRGRAFVVGAGDNRKSIVYVENLADRIVRLLGTELPGTLIAADLAPAQRELLTALAGSLGRPRPLALPRGPLLLAGRLLDVVSGSRWADRIRKLSAPSVFRGAALDARIEYVPRFDLGEALRRSAAWYGGTA